jgi:hypothetical protein
MGEDLAERRVRRFAGHRREVGNRRGTSRFDGTGSAESFGGAGPAVRAQGEEDCWGRNHGAISGPLYP